MESPANFRVRNAQATTPYEPLTHKILSCRKLTFSEEVLPPPRYNGCIFAGRPGPCMGVSVFGGHEAVAPPTGKGEWT